MLQGEHTTQWVLKAPAHTPALASLLSEFPDARIVQMHRDVVDTVTSACLLFAEFRSILSDEIDAVELGQWQTECLHDWFARARRARSERREVNVKVVDVSYAALVRDPMATVARLYEQFELELTPTAVELMRAHLSENPQHKHGRYQYSPEQFALEAGELRERFAWYSDEHGIDDGRR
jgi:hypothetical protein